MMTNLQLLQRQLKEKKQSNETSTHHLGTARNCLTILQFSAIISLLREKTRDYRNDYTNLSLL